MFDNPESVIMRVENFLVWICRFVTGTAFLVLIFSVLLQVASRTLGYSIVWTEELTRYSLLYMIAFGVGLALRSGDLVNVDIFCEKLPSKFPLYLRFFVGMVIGIFCVFLISPAIHFTKIGELQTSPAMGLKMNYVHVTMLILPLFLSIFAVFRILKISTGKSGGVQGNQHELKQPLSPQALKDTSQ